MSENVIAIGVGLDPSEVVTGVDRIREKLGELVEGSRAANEQFEAATQGLRSLFGGAAVLEGAEKLKELFGEVVSASERAEQAQLKLGAMIRATGDASGETVGHLRELAETLQGSSLFKSEDIENAEAALMRFRNVQGETFERAIKLSADYASLTGTDLVSAVTLFGRALEDPEKGMGRLQRVIGPLTESEREHIKALEEAGNLEGAQAVILDKLTHSVGGLAEAMDKGLLGSITHVKHAWEDVLASLGKSDSAPMTAAKEGLHGVAGELEQIASHMDQILNGMAVGAGTGAASMNPFMILSGALQGANQGLHSPLPTPAMHGNGLENDPSLAAALQRQQRHIDEESAATNKAQTAIDAYVESIKEQIATLQGVTKETHDLNAALDAAHTGLQRRQVYAAYDSSTVATLGARPKSHLTGDTTDSSLAIQNHVENQHSLAAWESGAMGDTGFSDAEIARAGGGRSDNTSMQQRFDEVKKQADEMERQILARQRQIAQQQEQQWLQLGEGMSSSFARTFDAGLQGQIKSFEQFTRQILVSWTQMLSQMAARQGGAAITKAIMSALGHPYGSAGASAGTTAADDTGQAAVAHSGGISGIDGGSRTVPMSLFMGAPKFHDGGFLGDDEVPTILQRGEGVFTQAQMAALGGGMAGGGDTHVHFNVQAIDSRDVAQFFEENKSHIAAKVTDALRLSRGTGRTMQKRL
jgi:hypothetical protein